MRRDIFCKTFHVVIRIGGTGWMSYQAKHCQVPLRIANSDCAGEFDPADFAEKLYTGSFVNPLGGNINGRV